MVKSRIVSEFIKKLQAAEESGDTADLAGLFNPEAELHNLTRPSAHIQSRAGGKPHVTGPDAFFNQYLSAFEYVSSHFTNVIEDEDNAVLEWQSHGRLRMGTPVDYRGVTILDHDGKKIRGLRTYYDSAALLPNTSMSAKSISETAGVPEITNEATS